MIQCSESEQDQLFAVNAGVVTATGGINIGVAATSKQMVTLPLQVSS